MDRILIRVEEAVDAVMLGPWQWGAADCCTSACDVFQRVFGIDPMAPLRGRYHSRGTAYRLIRAAGGFGALAQQLADRAGLRPVDWAPGALGVVQMPNGPALVVGVANGWWAGKTRLGYQTLRGVEAAWLPR